MYDIKHHIERICMPQLIHFSNLGVFPFFPNYHIDIEVDQSQNTWENFTLMLNSLRYVIENVAW